MSGKHTALARELERKREERMAKLSALVGTSGRSKPPEEAKSKPPTPANLGGPRKRKEHA